MVAYGYTVTLGDRLKQARMAVLPKVSGTAFAEELNRRLPGTRFTKAIVANYENNRTEVPEDVVRVAAVLFRRPFNWFYEGVLRVEPPPDSDARPEFAPPVRISPLGKVPLKMAGTVPAGGAWGDPLESEFYELMDAKFDGPKRFVAKVRGDSCYPALQQGDLAVWEVDDLPRYGTIVLVESLPDYGVTVKELVGGADGRPTLRQVNPRADVPPLDRDWKITARLVGVERRQPGMPEITLYDPGGLTVRQLIPFANTQGLRQEDEQGVPSEEAFGTPGVRRGGGE